MSGGELGQVSGMGCEVGSEGPMTRKNGPVYILPLSKPVVEQWSQWKTSGVIPIRIVGTKALIKGRLSRSGADYRNVWGLAFAI